MRIHRRDLLTQALSCWNWKCALLSASVRSLVYLAAMARGGGHNRLAVVLVEIIYVTLTAGIYAGMQQKALGLRSRALGNLIIVVGVPGTSQLLDWLAHRMAHAAVTPRAILAVSMFALISALFHLHVMRNGVFLSGHGQSLASDFRRVPRLTTRFVAKPIALFTASIARLAGAESEASL